MAALEAYAPGAIRAISGVTGSTARDVASADAAVAPIYNQLYREGQLASADTEADIAEGPGQRLVSAADTAQRTLDPEFYSSRAVLGDAVKKYLDYDPYRMSPTELAEISRGINATEGTMPSSALRTVHNAQTFGAAGTNRWKNFGEAITRASTAIPSLRSGLNGFAVATSRGQNPMGSGLGGAGGFASGQNFGFANNALGNISATQRAIYGINDANSPINLALKASEVFKNVGQGIGGAAQGFSGGQGGAAVT